MPQGKDKKDKKSTAANLGFEAQLWQAADALRGSMDAAEYKHVVLGLIFLKYISDAFEEQHAKLEAETKQGADPEDPDEYRALNIFWVPPEARWSHLKNQAKQPTIGQLVDDAMAGIERDNPSLRGVLPKDYARPGLDKIRLGQLIDLVSNIKVGDEESRSKDILGRVYEYFLSQFASAEGKKGGEFYTPRCVVKLLVEMIEPYKGRVYDPCCGSSGMFVQSVEFIRAHASGNGNGGKAKGDISIYGQESNYTTWRLARMNLALRGIDGQIAHGDTFHNDRHPDLKADYILANPPFNVSDWGGERLRDDKRWQYGVPPAGNANFAWVQHIVYHLAPSGVAGFVLANGSMSSNQSGEGEIRKNLIEADLVDCMVALPGQLFYSTQIPACLWFFARDKKNHKFRDRRGEGLFIDARKLGVMIDRTHRELIDEEVTRIANTYHAWRGEKDADPYEDVPGFCKAATLDEIRKHGHVLTPGRYVGTLDDKIELNRRMNETLEAMARAIFKSWFVDFDPVRAKAEGSDPGLPKKIADLFPDRFENSELGEIPAGWRVLPFTDTVEVIGGGTPKTSIAKYWEGEIPWYSVVDAPPASDVWVIDTEKKITQAGVENSSTKILPVGTTIISARGTVGKIALVGVPMAMNQSCYGLRGKLGPKGFFNYFSVNELVEVLKQRAHGSVFDTITRETLAGAEKVVPTLEIIDAFEFLVGPSLQRIRENTFQSRTLAALRDALLPKLISGELRVDKGGVSDEPDRSGHTEKKEEEVNAR